MTSLTKRSTALLLILSMLFAGLMGSSRVQAEADAESANRIIFEDFENGAPDEFVLDSVSAPYSVVQTEDGNHVYRNFNSSDKQYAYYKKDDLPDDYSVEADIRLDSWGGLTPAVPGLFLKYADADNYYGIGYEKSGGTASAKFHIRKRYNNTTSYLAMSAPTSFNTNKVYKVRGEIVGSRILLYVDDVLLLDVVDSNNPLTSGYPGLFALRTNVDYDNFAVYDATPVEVPEAPSGLSMTEKTSSTVTLRWNPSPSEEVQSYQLFNNGAQVEDATSPVFDSDTDTWSATARNLTPETAYSFTVRSVGSNGLISEDSAAVQVTTEEAVAPEPPFDVHVIETTSTTAKLQWNPSPSSDVSKYVIYNGDSPAVSVSSSTYDVNGGLYSALVFNLEPSTEYAFTIRAHTTTELASVPSNDVIVSTPALSGDSATPLTIAGYRASGSDSNIPEYVIDGDIQTRWSAYDDGQWIELDLGSEQLVSYLGVAFYRGDNRSKTIDIEVSNDQTNWTRVYSGDSSGTTIQVEAFGFETVTARYVRVVGRGASEWTSISEIQVYPPHVDGFILSDVEIPPTGPDPDSPIPTKAGLYYADGTPHVPHEAQTVTGSMYNVLDFGADPADNGIDDAQAIRAALAAAALGDEVYIPNGHYQLTSTDTDGVTHFIMKSGVQVRGESQDGVLLVSDHANEQEEYATVEGIVFRMAGQNNIKISNMTITSSWDLNYSTNTSVANPARGGPKQVIMIISASGKPSYNITLDGLTIEKFQRIGVVITNSHDVIVENSLFRNATDLAEGGNGYGVSIEGKSKESRLGREDDSRFNVVRNNDFIGPYLRHGTMAHSYTHNNLIENNYYLNSALDAIDFHGEDEYMNEVSYNHIVGGGEAAVGVGNPGATHDAAGPGNYIHNNLIENVKRYGVQVYLGSPDTIIENNTITGFTNAGSQGIRLKNAPGTIVKGNQIVNNTASDFWGIIAMKDDGDPTNAGNGAGIPENIVIQDNHVTGNTNGVLILHGTNIRLFGNKISGNTGTDYENQVVVSELIPATRAASVQQNAQNAPVANLLQIKGGKDSASVRSYQQFDLNSIEGKLATAWLYVYGQALESPAGETGAATSLYAVDSIDWDSDTMQWNTYQSPPELGQKLSTVQLNNKGEYAWYVFDATVLVQERLDGDRTISLAYALNADQTGYLTHLYNGSDSSYRPYLRVETYPPVELAAVAVTADRSQLVPGMTTQLHVTGTYNTGLDVSLENADISFISLTPDLVTVDNTGVVTALQAGEATLQATVVLDGVARTGMFVLNVTNNLAITAQLSVDSTLGTNTKDRVLDGSLETRWISNGSQTPYLMLDWTKEQTINQVKLWSGHVPVIGSANWHVRDFDLQILKNGEWKTIAEVRDNDQDAFLGQYTTLNLETPVVTAALRFHFVRPSWGNGNSNDMMARINEVFVGFIND